jgi:cobalt-zinc-cadmium efflux system membrane fusion protein
VKPGDATASHLTVRAPISGKVCELAAAHGSYWNDVNTPLMVLANLNRINLTANVQEKDIPRLYAGQEATATLASFPGEVFRTRVVTTGELLDPETRTTKVRMPLENRRGRLLPAMFATVSFTIKPHKGILVPTPAVLQDTEGSKVFVEVAPWTFQERRVKVGAQVSQQTEVVQGLKAGERIVVKEGVLLHAH